MTSPIIGELQRKPSKVLTVALVLVSGIVAIGGIAWYVKNSKSNEQSAISNSAKSSLQVAEIVALGRLEPEGELISVAGYPGARIAQLKVLEGDFVQKGQVIAYLDSYAEQLMQRDLAASQVMEIQQRMATDTRLQQTEIERANIQIDQVDVPQALQIQSQRALVRRLSAELSEAVRVRDRFSYLRQEGATAQQDLDMKELAVRQAQESLGQARATLAQVAKARDANLQEAKMNAQRSHLAFEQVSSHSGLLSAKRNLDLAEAKLDRAIIRAPRNGQILKVFAQDGEAITNQGVVQMGNTRQMEVVAEVYEADIKQVKLGQQATITSPTLTQSLTGEVVQLGRVVYKNNLLGDDPTAATDARVVEVRIRLNDSQSVASLSKLQVTVRIQTKRAGVAQHVF